MPAGTTPIFTRAPDVQWSTANITAANTAKDGTGTVDTVFTADATEGSYLERLTIRPRGTNVASVLRIFINNGLTNVTPANNTFFAEQGLTATANSEVAAIQGAVIPMNIALQPGFRVQVTIGTAVAGGFSVTGNGGKY